MKKFKDSWSLVYFKNWSQGVEIDTESFHSDFIKQSKKQNIHQLQLNLFMLCIVQWARLAAVA